MTGSSFFSFTILDDSPQFNDRCERKERWFTERQSLYIATRVVISKKVSQPNSLNHNAAPANETRKRNRTRIPSSHPTRSSIKPRPRRRCIISTTARFPERRRRHRSKGLTITHLLLLLLLVVLLVLLVLLRLLVLVLLEIGGRGRLPGGVGLDLFLFFDLHEVALEAFEVAGGGLDEVFGLVGGFEGFEHGADLRGVGS
jgi:hypothetical protein